MAEASPIATTVRAFQCASDGDDQYGFLWQTFYTVVDRLLEEFWSEWATIPYPILSMDFDREEMLGWFEPYDCIGLPCRLNINPQKLKNGLEAAEVIAHELLHVWEWYLAEMGTENNVHTEFFKDQMWEIYGINVEIPSGRHFGNDGRWDEWLSRNTDLHLDKILFPGNVPVLRDYKFPH